MKSAGRYLRMMISSMLVMLLFTACSSSSDEARELPTLDIYIYAPDHAMPTRSESMASLPVENEVRSLQIWVYQHDNGNTLGTIELSEDQLANLNSSLHGEVYHMEMTEEFAEKKPNVDVYVLANVRTSNCGIEYHSNLSRSSLEDARIDENYFCPVVEVPEAGFPMSGVLRNTAVGGKNPVFRITTTQLMRTVSKIRFVFSSSTIREETLYIDGVKLDAQMIPKLEYLFLNDENPTYRISGSYNSEEITLLGADAVAPVNKSPDPEYYKYNGQANYATIIDEAVKDNLLTEAPSVYLRESDKQLQGTIYYHVGNDLAPRTARFSMAEVTADNRFARNHTWIVYGYYSASGLVVSEVDVTDWDDGGTTDQDVYNW